VSVVEDYIVAVVVADEVEVVANLTDDDDDVDDDMVDV
jgi:hypothetical protein